MIVAGIDIGINTGVAVVEKQTGQIIFLEKINTNHITYLEMFDVFSKIIVSNRVKYIGYEKPIYHANIKSIQKYIEKVSTLKLIASMNRIPIFELYPNTIKKSMIGFGKASKYQLKEMLKNMLDKKVSSGYDVSDALAIAFTLINKLESEANFMCYKNS